MTDALGDKPTCVVCKEIIEVVNPLEMRDGFYHRACWTRQCLNQLGVNKIR
jgi:hypothetical protein